MVPKIIHYCWFGKKPLPILAKKCIESWKRFLPDYEIREWNEDNFDINVIPYTKEAYKAKKYAFVSDYARFWILYKYGGLYFDTDVEIIKPINDIIDNGSFMGCESEFQIGISTKSVAPGLGLGCYAKHPFYKKMLDIYANIHFIKDDGTFNFTTIVEYTTKCLRNEGLRDSTEIQNIANIWIYPKDYFCPIDYTSKQCLITENTRTIHHFAASWHPKNKILSKCIKFIFGEKIFNAIIKLRNFIKQK